MKFKNINETPFITREHLIEARKIIEEKGLCKGALSNSSGQYCTIGAYLYILGEVPEKYTYKMWPVYEFFDSIAPGGNIVQYNDLESTTKTNILKLYDSAIEKFSE